MRVKRKARPDALDADIENWLANHRIMHDPDLIEMPGERRLRWKLEQSIPVKKEKKEK